MSKTKTGIKLNIVLNGEKKKIPFFLEDKFSDFIPLLESTFKTKMEDYEVYIGKNMVENYNKSLNDIIGKEINPQFNFKKIEKVKETLNAKDTFNVNDSISFETKEIIPKVTVEGFPSRPEMIELLDKFMSQHGAEKEYKIINRDQAMDIIFKESVVFNKIGFSI
jgi:hypothetical protein